MEGHMDAGLIGKVFRGLIFIFFRREEMACFK
jgi:hypothetical protein